MHRACPPLLALFGLDPTLSLAIYIAAGVLLALLLFWIVFRVHRLPLRILGFRDIPAVPFIIAEFPATLVRLLLRLKQIQLARFGLSTRYTVAGLASNGYTFMYGRGEFEHLTRLTLNSPEQFAMAWTTLGGLHAQASANLLPTWARTLTDRAVADAQFWPIIARYNIPFGIPPLQRATGPRANRLRTELGSAWTSEMELLTQAGDLYALDTTFVGVLRPRIAKGAPRVAPATLTLLRQDPATKSLTPFYIRVAGHNGAGVQAFDHSATDAAWLYALQAAKTSATVSGIWLGHVYPLHMVTAAMAMTMLKEVPRHHILRQLLGRQAKFVIGFNQFMLAFWTLVVPPTAVNSARQFLQLMDAAAPGRGFFDDDPPDTIARLGLDAARFSSGAAPDKQWDLIPCLRALVSIWHITEDYVSAVIDSSYLTDHDVATDQRLQNWLHRSANQNGGNIRGLGRLDTIGTLKRLLTSLIYRVTSHGSARMNQIANPGLTFVANYPPCLHVTDIPAPDAQFDTARLLQYMPRTGTIGEMARFLFVFADSSPYEAFIPLSGMEAELSFRGPAADACNSALIAYRTRLAAFMEWYAAEWAIPNCPPRAVQIHQWPLNVET